MKMIKFFTAQLALLFLLMGFSSYLHAQTAEPIGLILSTSGTVTAEAEDGSVRKLRRRSPVYEGDAVITGSRSRAQIRFNDNGLVALQPETRFVIEEHNFKGQEDGTESAAYRLLRGGIQAITGLIGNRNKDRYRFQTPLATIGLRGTHWAVTFCDTSCGDLPPGLYGGVAEGGIDVCNGGGCEGFDKDGYFYVPDENTKPQTLIDPPSVVFDTTSDRGDDESEDEADSSEGDGSDDSSDGDDGSAEDGSENSDSSEGNEDTAGVAESDSDGGASASDTDGDAEVGAGDDSEGSDVTQFSSPPDDSGDGVVNPLGGDTIATNNDLADPIQCSNAPNASNPCDPDAETDEGTFTFTQIQSGDAEEVIETIIEQEPAPQPEPQPIYNVDTSVTVESTEGVAVVSGIGSLQGQDGVTRSQAFPTSVLPLVGDALRLTELEGINTVVGFDIVETEEDGLEIDCDPCLQINDALLVEFGTYSSNAFSVDYGRWISTNTDVTTFDFETGQDVDITMNPDLHFGYTEDQNFQLAGLGQPLYATYSYVAGTSPTDQDGNVGAVNDITMELDLYQQAIVAFSMSLDISDEAYIAQLDPRYSTVYLYTDESIEFDLVGICQGGDCGNGIELEGETSLIFVGENAEGVLGSYGLNTFGSDIREGDIGNTPYIGVTGAYVLEAGGTVNHPAFYDGTQQQLEGSQSAILLSSYLQLDSFLGFFNPVIPTYFAESSDSFNLVSIDQFSNLPTNFAACDGECSDLLINEAVLAEYGDFGFNSGATVNWGRWFTQDFDYFSFEDGTINPIVHFGYTEDFNDDFSFYDSSITDRVLSYSLVGGTAPTDEFGRTGQLAWVDMSLNFYNMSISTFEMGLAIDERRYFARLSGDQSLPFMGEGIGENIAIGDFSILNLAGSCSGGDCGDHTPIAGIANLNFVGESANDGSAEGILGSYALISKELYDFFRFGFEGPIICEDGPECFPLSTSPFDGFPLNSDGFFPSANGVFVLEQYESPLTVSDSSLSSNVPSGLAAFFGSSMLVDYCDGGCIDLEPFSGLVIEGGSTTHPFSDVLGGGSLDIANLTDLDGSSIDAVFGALWNNGDTNFDLIVNEGTLVELGNISDTAEIFWGSWVGDVTLDDTADIYESNHFHYVYSQDWTTDLPEIDSNFDVYFSYVAGPSPVDQYGYLGNVDYIEMTVDFNELEISSFEAEFLINSMHYSAYFDPMYSDGPAPIDLVDGLLTASIPLEGYLGSPFNGCDLLCDGGGFTSIDGPGGGPLYGGATIAFAGEGAEFALGSLELMDDYYEEYAATLSFVLGQGVDDHFFDINVNDTETASSGAVALGAGMIALTNPATALTDAQSLSGIADSGIVLTNIISRDHIHPNSVVAGNFVGDSAVLETSGVPIVTGLSEALLVQYDNTGFDGSEGSYEAYWGRWQSYDQIEVDETLLDSAGEYAHFAYSEDLITQSEIDALELGGVMMSYFYMGRGTSPTDNFGDVGYVNSINMDIDFGEQEITYFDMSVYTDSTGNWNAGLVEGNPVALNGATQNFEVSGSLNHTYDVIGNVNTAILGPNADAVLGAYNLSVDPMEGIDKEVIGTFLLEDYGYEY